jgi:hypothetical protein
LGGGQGPQGPALPPNTLPRPGEVDVSAQAFGPQAVGLAHFELPQGDGAAPFGDAGFGLHRALFNCGQEVDFHFDGIDGFPCGRQVGKREQSWRQTYFAMMLPLLLPVFYNKQEKKY